MASFAWGEAKFGMTKAEVNATPQFRNMRKVISYNDNLRYAAPSSTNQGIKKSFDLFYWPPTLYAEFGGEKNDELIEVTLESHYFPYHYFEYLADDYKKIASFLTEKMGAPKESNLDIEAFELPTRELTTLARWDVGSKQIVLYVYKTADLEFQSEFVIRNYSFPKTHKAPKQEEKKIIDAF